MTRFSRSHLTTHISAHFTMAFCSMLLMMTLASSTAHAQAWRWPWGDNSSSISDSSQNIAPKLPALSADAKAVTVSGLSAGAYMAVQLHMAYSSSISGVGVIAGGPWMCSDGNVYLAQTTCMDSPANVDVSKLVSLVKVAQGHRQIDSTSNLSSSRVYLFNSPIDDVIREPMNSKNNEFYSNFVPAAQIHLETSIKAAHGMPTLDYGRTCSSFGDPYFNNCGFDTAGEVLKFIYGDRSSTFARKAADLSSLHEFDQTEFGSESALLGPMGWVYVPKKCAVAGSNCPLHVVMHGCLQTPEHIKDTFPLHAGYNEWAEGSGVIILYPQAKTSLMNPKGCFDWWGYTAANFATKSGPQMKVIKAMMTRLTSP